MKWKLVLIAILLHTSYFILHTSVVNAASNDSYNLNITGIDSAQNTKPTPTPTPQQPIIQVGFKNNQDASLTFSLSESFVDFGPLSPTNPIIRETALDLLNNTAEGASVQAFENHPLKDETSGNVIPDTSCDNGSCTSVISSPWTGTLTYGFGYRCEDPLNSCASDFRDSFYKRFASDEENEPAQTVIQTSDRPQTSSKITYKVNISGAQKQGAYSNTITFIAVPNY